MEHDHFIASGWRLLQDPPSSLGRSSSSQKSTSYSHFQKKQDRGTGNIKKKQDRSTGNTKLFSSSHVSDDDLQESDTADATWPDGTLGNVRVPESNVSGPGKMPYVGWALCQSAQKGLTNGHLRMFYYCLGVYRCPECDCVARPLLPDSHYKKNGCPPRPPPHTCVVHKTQPLVWNECTDGENGGPCRIIATYAGGRISDKINFTHIGNHGHPKPLVKKPSPESLR